jgi:guanine deaminase
MPCPTCAAQHAALHPTRRAFIAALALAAAAPGAALAQLTPPLTPPSPEVDAAFMRIALGEAEKADFPFGAVIVRHGAEIARGRNLGRTNGDPTAHGEMMAIRNALASHGSRDLIGATLYTTGEPCAMCMGAILWCRFGRLVYAASIAELATRMNQIEITSAQLAADAPFEITGGVLADEAMALFK